MVEFEVSDKKVIKELSDRVGEFGEKLKNLETAVSDLSDLQLINKLDIINLKNQIDKVRLIIGDAPMPPMPIPVQEAPEEAPEKPKKKEKQQQMPAPTSGSKAIMPCEKCGAPMPAAAKFCTKCGKKVKR